MERKTIKTPSAGFKLFVPSAMAPSLKASFYATATPLATTTDVVQAHRRKNRENRGQKPNLFGLCRGASGVRWNSKDRENHFSLCAAGFLVFSSDDVLSCKATSDEGRACVKACFQTQNHDISTEARRAKTSEEGFLRFLLITEI